MISEGSCDTEDWSDDYNRHDNKNVFKCIKIENLTILLFK